MARPKKAIDPRQVEQLAAIGCTYEEMAAVLDCSKDTLKRRFAPLIQKGRDSGCASLRRKQFELAMKGDRTMLVWLGKQYLNQTDRQRVENVDLSNATDEQLARIANGENPAEVLAGHPERRLKLA